VESALERDELLECRLTSDWKSGDTDADLE